MLQFNHFKGDTTEKLFFHTIYSVSKLIDVLYFVLIYTQKGLFQWPSKGGASQWIRELLQMGTRYWGT